MTEKSTIKRRSFLVGLSSLLSVFIPIPIPSFIKNVEKGFERRRIYSLGGRVKYRAKDMIESSYVYAPYIPVVITSFPLGDDLTNKLSKIHVSSNIVTLNNNISRRDSFKQLFGF